MLWTPGKLRHLPGQAVLATLILESATSFWPVSISVGSAWKSRNSS